MNKLLIGLVAVSFIVFACDKEEDAVALPFNEQLTIDSTIIENYFLENNITDVLYDCYTGSITEEPCDGYVSYILQEEGSGLFPPSPSASVVVSYQGKFLETGKEFESNPNIEFTIEHLIAGWQVMLLNMREGDSVTIYIPSGYGYGFTGSANNIPSNTNLIFEMKLIQVN